MRERDTCNKVTASVDLKENMWEGDESLTRSTPVGLCSLTTTLLTFAKVKHKTPFLNKIFGNDGGEKN